MALIQSYGPLTAQGDKGLLAQIDVSPAVQATDTVFSVHPEGYYASLVGKNFEYSDENSLQSGTIKSLIVTDDEFGIPFLRADQLKVDVEKLHDLEQIDPNAALKYILRGDDSIITNQFAEFNDKVVSYGGDDFIGTGPGDDTIRAGKGNDVLDGQSGNDTLYGGKGVDILIGNLGDDTMTGGKGNDTFVFLANYGHDTITDFKARHDKIELSLVNFQSFDDVKDNWKQVGDDVVITLPPAGGAGAAPDHHVHSGDPGLKAQTLTIENVDLSDLTSRDFLLV